MIDDILGQNAESTDVFFPTPTANSIQIAGGLKRVKLLIAYVETTLVEIELV